MSADFSIKQGDTQPIFAQQLLDNTGSPVNLTGATVTLALRSQTATAPLTLTGQVSIFDAPNGKVEWKPSAADTATAGNYLGAWQVTFSNGAVQTFPTDGYLWVEIEPNLLFTDQQLVSLPDVKDYLTAANIQTDRSHDAKLLRFIAAATPLIEAKVGPVIVRTFEEWHEAGQYWIQLRRRPSTALGANPVLTLMACDEYRGPIKYTLSEITDPAAASIYSVMLDRNTATLYRRTTGGGVIPFGAGPWGGGMPDGVHVVYQAGQNPVPENVREACLEAIRVNYMTTQPVGAGSWAQADELDRTAPPLGFTLPRRALELLAPMRRHSAVA